MNNDDIRILKCLQECLYTLSNEHSNLAEYELPYCIGLMKAKLNMIKLHEVTNNETQTD